MNVICNHCKTEQVQPTLKFPRLIQTSLLLAIVGTLGLYGLSFWLAEKYDFFTKLQIPKATIHTFLVLFALIFFIYSAGCLIVYLWNWKRFRSFQRTGECTVCNQNTREIVQPPPLPTVSVKKKHTEPPVLLSPQNHTNPTISDGIPEDDKYVGQLAELAFSKLVRAQGYHCESMEQSKEKYRELVEQHGIPIKQEDFIVMKNGKAIPVEVKTRSLYLDNKTNYFSLRVCEKSAK